MVDPNLPCELCGFCRRGQPHLCEDMTTLGIFRDGGLARYNVVPQRALHKLPEALAPTSAVLIEPLACVVHGIDQLYPHSGETAVILGAGPIGLMFTQLLHAAGVRRVIVSEPGPFRRERALENGAYCAVDPTADDLREIVRNLTDGRGADMVVDAVGSAMEAGMRAVRPGGRCLVFGQNQTYRAEIAPYAISRHEIEILGSFIAPFCFPRTIDLIDQGLVEPERLISHRLSMPEIHQGIELLRQGDALKVVIDVAASS
ncbi:MAG: zinc-binding dehydrogenase [Salinibacter sp.]